MNTLAAETTANTAPVIVTMTGFERVTGMGAVIALANVDIEIGGIGLQLQGVRVVRQSDGLACRPPVWRHPSSGRWLPGVILPKPVEAAIADAVFETWNA